MSSMFCQHYWQWIEDLPLHIAWSSSVVLWHGETKGVVTPSAPLLMPPEPISAGSELAILSEQRDTLLLRLRLALWCRQVPAVGCLSPGCNVDVGQAWHISHSGCHHYKVCPGAVVLLS